MKKMKLFCGILIGLMIFSSCSSDDDSNSDSISIIGIWKPIKEVGVCQDGSEQIDEYSISEQESEKLTFNSNGTFSGFSGFYNGTWDITDNKLYLTENGTRNVATFFELTNNRLRIGSIEENPFDDPCSATVGLSHYYTEYIK